jgi:hypothetical protein
MQLFNRGDIDAAVELLDLQGEWTEPSEFPGGSTYHGLDGVKRYLTQSRESAAEVISEPERFIPAGIGSSSSFTREFCLKEPARGRM